MVVEMNYTVNIEQRILVRPKPMAKGGREGLGKEEQGLRCYEIVHHCPMSRRWKCFFNLNNRLHALFFSHKMLAEE